MSEYVITIEDWFFKHVHERYTHFFGCPIEEIVRCGDCKYKDESWNCAAPYNVEPNGFCAWGEKASNFATCKCGEDIETNGRESVSCPSCGRVITE